MGKLTFLLAVFCMVCLAACTGPDDEVTPPATQGSETSGYDSVLASKLGADDYGMKNYTVCFLKPGKQQLMPVQEVETLEQNHLQYMHRLAEEGRLVMFGMFLGNRELYTQLVFDTQDMSLADSIMQQDPKVKAGVVVPEFHLWYGPAALRELKSIHERIARINYKSTESR